MSPDVPSGSAGGRDARGEVSVKKIAVRVSAVGGGLLALLLSGGAMLVRK